VEKDEVRKGLRTKGIYDMGDVAVGVSHHQIKMQDFICIVEEWKRGGKNEYVDGGEQAEQENYFSLARFGKRVGWIGIGGVHGFSQCDTRSY
jgi:hypothetical protein